MDKKLTNIKRMVDASGEDFYNYLIQTEEPSLMEFLQKVSVQTEVYIFSGVIRNFFLGEKNNRDIDIILGKEVDFLKFLPNAIVKKNSFGGYKIAYNKTTIDLWYLEQTWAFRNDHVEVLHFALESKIPGTAFFNFSAVVYLLKEKVFLYSEHFLTFLKDQEIDYVYDKNPNYKLCVLNTFYYSDKYKLNVTDKLKYFVVELYNSNDKDYEKIQLSHFGKVLYSNNQIEHRVETIFHPRKKHRKKNILKRN